MKGSGTIPTLIIFVVIVVTSLLVFLVLPNIISVWESSCDFVSNVVSTVTLQQVKNACTKSPVQIEVVIKPEYLPLVADHALRALLETTDSSSGKQVQELLAYGVQNKKPTFSLDGKNVELEKIVDDKMNSLLPDREYSLVVSNLFNFGNPNLGDLLRPASGDAGNFTKYKSSTTLTTPDMKKVQVVLFIR
ncbi:MAG: hypothetical protein J4452_00065 [Candidatus Aenigmarchaeota archaeon]|nr:hypothetical protein [Candidatus Aenigmarchaeota archaeon]